MPGSDFPLSSGRLELGFQAKGKRLHWTQLNDRGVAWLHPALGSRLFAVYLDGRRYDAANLDFLDLQRVDSAPGVVRCIASFQGGGFSIQQWINLYENTALIETGTILLNHSRVGMRVSRIDTFSVEINSADLELHFFESAWGAEFEPQTCPLRQKIILQTRAGRSSNSMHPWFGLFTPQGRVFSGSMAWSGNWIFRFEPQKDNRLQVSGGMHPWGFQKILQPGERLESPPGILVLGADLDEAAQQYTQVGRKYWYPRNALSSLIPIEWNHWWSYEDFAINEQVFSQNIDAAAKMGVEVCTLDAGWFGPSEAGAHWYDYRGDWDQVNLKRFPHGIRPLADQVHARGMHFGLWCEIEGLGKQARLAEEHPDFVATRRGKRLGYVCLGNPSAQEWAFQTLIRLIQEHGCDWIKLDFNLNPGAGCDRSDHGHQAGDGLYAHYQGYYRMLARLRQAYPEVVVENCSSGGLRIDPGILRQTHMTFLSDPDWPVHDLQIFWGASTLIPPERCLHWSFSDWCNQNPPPQQTFNPHSPELTPRQLDYYTRIAMLGWFGISQKLPELPLWVAERLTTHIRVYKEQVRRFIREAALYRLTEQPRRSGAGERWAAFQYSLPGGGETLLFVFRLPGGEPVRTIRLKDLQPDRLYTVQDLDGAFTHHQTGAELMTTGITFAGLLEEDSALLKIA